MTIPTRPFPFQDLPEDIARSVLEIAAENLRGAGLALTMVCKTVQAWTEPYLYRHIEVDTSAVAGRLHRTILSHKRPQIFALYVKSLSISHYSSWNAILDILDLCTGLNRIELHEVYMPQGAGVDVGVKIGKRQVWDKPRPKRLLLPASMFLPERMHFRCFNHGQEANPIFTNVTHLELLCTTETLTSWTWSTLFKLTKLTHLCLDTPPSLESTGLAEQLLASTISYLPSSLLLFVLSMPFSQYKPLSSTSSTDSRKADSSKAVRQWLNSSRQLVEGSSGLDARLVFAVDKCHYDGWPGETWMSHVIWRYVTGPEARQDSDSGAFWRRGEVMIGERRVKM
ncbi:hypothetical protein DFP72DRAFT_941091 [Ephemerocybe angulata]|uniref:Uncharacterized protein n=1 Tax=Ephemerocybe angulata TaxID=980116 RepID=A0A8H6H8K3_9AGAR|nr:hypothetical protein DFP72DRAFT_941091 [Tulosesus angulatus]